MGVSGKVAGCPETLELRAKPREVGVRGRRDMNMRQRQPVLKAPHDGFNGKRSGDDLTIRRNAHKSEHCGPSETDAFGA
jgi:hypothetical protein